MSSKSLVQQASDNGAGKCAKRLAVVLEGLPNKDKIKTLSIKWKEFGEYPGDLTLPEVGVEYE